MNIRTPHLLALLLSGCSALQPDTGPPQSAGGGGSDASISDASTTDAAASDTGVVVRSDGGCNSDSDPSTPVSFKNQIRPMLDRLRNDPNPGCRSCHYSTEPQHVGLDDSGLDLATLGALRQGGNRTRGIIVIAGQPCDSAIVQKLRGTFSHGVRMPKDASRYWTDAEIQLLSDWIAEGALGADNE